MSRRSLAIPRLFSALSRRNQTIPKSRPRLGEDQKMASNGKKKSKRNGKLPATPHPKGKELRSPLWGDNPENPGMTPLYLEGYRTFGLPPKELRSGKPIIGIAQTGSDLSP